MVYSRNWLVKKKLNHAKRAKIQRGQYINGYTRWNLDYVGDQVAKITSSEWGLNQNRLAYEQSTSMLCYAGDFSFKDFKLNCNFRGLTSPSQIQFYQFQVSITFFLNLSNNETSNNPEGFTYFRFVCLLQTCNALTGLYVDF